MMPLDGKSKQALGMAYRMKGKPEGKAQGGVCHACGGQMAHGGRAMDEETMENMQPSGTSDEREYKEFMPEPEGFEMSESQSNDDEDEMQHFSEGGGVDQYDPASINDADGDSDDLEYSPEIQSGTVDNEKGEDDKRQGFLRAYMVHRKLRGR